VTADAIIEALEDGQSIEIRDAVIVGEIVSETMQLPVEIGPDGVERRVIKGAILIEDSVFQDVVSFSRVTFRRDTVFLKVQFSQGAAFNPGFPISNWVHRHLSMVK